MYIPKTKNLQPGSSASNAMQKHAMSAVATHHPKLQLGTMVEIISRILGKLDFESLKQARLVCKLWADEAAEFLLHRTIFLFSCTREGQWHPRRSFQRQCALPALKSLLCSPFLRDVRRSTSTSTRSPVQSKSSIRFDRPPWPVLRPTQRSANYIAERVTELGLPLQTTASELNKLINFFPKVHTLNFSVGRVDQPRSRSLLQFYRRQNRPNYYMGELKLLQGLHRHKGLQENLERRINLIRLKSQLDVDTLWKISNFLDNSSSSSISSSGQILDLPDGHKVSPVPRRGLRSISTLHFSDSFHRPGGSNLMGHLLESKLCVNHWRISKLSLEFYQCPRVAPPPGLLRKFLSTSTFSTSLRELSLEGFTPADRCRRWLSDYEPRPWEQEESWEIPNSLLALKILTFGHYCVDSDEAGNNEADSTDFEEAVSYFMAAILIQTLVQLPNLPSLNLSLYESLREGQVEKISNGVAGIIDRWNSQFKNGKEAEGAGDLGGAFELSEGERMTRLKPAASLRHLELNDFSASVLFCNPGLSALLAGESLKELTCQLVLTTEGVRNILGVIFTRLSGLRHLDLTLQNAQDYKELEKSLCHRRETTWEALLLGRGGEKGALNREERAHEEDEKNETSLFRLRETSIGPSIRQLKGLTGLRIKHSAVSSADSSSFLTDIFIKHGLSHMPSLLGVKISPRQGFSQEATRHLTSRLSPYANLDI